MQPDGQMDQQMDGLKNDGDMRESAEGEKYFMLEKREIVYCSDCLTMLHRKGAWRLKQ